MDYKDSDYFFFFFDIMWNTGNMGAGWNFFKDDNMETYFDFLNISIKNNYLKIGLEYIPVKSWYNTIDENININNYSFINFNLFWNVFEYSFFDEYLRLTIGPYNSINYMYMTNNEFDWSKYCYTFGFRIKLILYFNDSYNKSIFNSYYFNIITTEIGYRNMDRKNSLYLGVNVDVTWILIYFIGILSNNN
jgi:hypothetical protein